MKYMSIPFLNSLIYYEDVDLIYVTNDPWIIYRSEKILCGWLNNHPGDGMLDYLWRDKIYVML